jgi:hypothetical protein
MAAGPMNPPMPGVRRTGDGALVVGLSHRPMLARTAERRFIGNPPEGRSIGQSA